MKLERAQSNGGETAVYAVSIVFTCGTPPTPAEPTRLLHTTPLHVQARISVECTLPAHRARRQSTTKQTTTRSAETMRAAKLVVGTSNRMPPPTQRSHSPSDVPCLTSGDSNERIRMTPPALDDSGVDWLCRDGG